VFGGSALVTLVGHSADSTVEWSTLWSGADATVMITLVSVLLGCVAALVLAMDWRFWRGEPSRAARRKGAVRLA